MTYNLKPAAVFAISLFAFPALAISQDTTESTNDLALGELLIDGLTVGSTYTRETHGDWKIRCVRTENLKDPCQLYQLMKDQDDNSVAEISLFQLPPGQTAVAGATVAVPLETLLTEQLTLSVDGGNSKRYPFSWCTSLGCFARIGLTADDIAGFQRGASASLSIVPLAASDQTVSLNLSLSGFTAGFEAVRASNAANAANTNE